MYVGIFIRIDIFREIKIATKFDLKCNKCACLSKARLNDQRFHTRREVIYCTLCSISVATTAKDAQRYNICTRECKILAELKCHIRAAHI